MKDSFRVNKMCFFCSSPYWIEDLNLLCKICIVSPNLLIITKGAKSFKVCFFYDFKMSSRMSNTWAFQKPNLLHKTCKYIFSRLAKKSFEMPTPSNIWVCQLSLFSIIHHCCHHLQQPCPQYFLFWRRIDIQGWPTVEALILIDRSGQIRFRCASISSTYPGCHQQKMPSVTENGT